MTDTLVERAAELPATPDSPAAARRLLREVLDACGRRDWLGAAELALSELTTNVVLHAHTGMTVRISCGSGRLRVEVEDGSPVAPAQRSYGVESSTGRGLALVAVLAQEHGTVPTETGKIVWFSLSDDQADDEDGPDVDALLDAWGEDLLPAPTGRPAASVVLAGFPPTLWLAAVQMHDALLRELALYRAGRGLAVDDLAAADRARFAVRTALDQALAGERARAAARDPLPQGHPARLPAVPAVLDLEVPVAPDAAADFAVLQDVLDEANRLAAEGQLLTRPSLPEVVALRDWVAEQVISSSAGQAPMPWPGADAEHFARQLDQGARELAYDVAAVVDDARTAIVVDSQNRILGISPPLAELLGWAVEDLVGRRVVAIVPPRLRESHVAGFTRHLSTGEAHALRVDLQLPVLRSDGTELLCHLWIDADRDRSGHPVYLAHVSPVQAETPPGADDRPPAPDQDATKPRQPRM